MLSLKKRLVVGITLLILLIATVLPAGAQDTSTSSLPSPTPSTSIVTLTSDGSGFTVTQSIPIRCGTIVRNLIVVGYDYKGAYRLDKL